MLKAAGRIKTSAIWGIKTQVKTYFLRQQFIGCICEPVLLCEDCDFASN
ncbi:MAG: hypothetical protein WBA89_14705 [Microcoleus sp.]